MSNFFDELEKEWPKVMATPRSCVLSFALGAFATWAVFNLIVEPALRNQRDLSEKQYQASAVEVARLKEKITELEGQKKNPSIAPSKIDDEKKIQEHAESAPLTTIQTAAKSRTNQGAITLENLESDGAEIGVEVQTDGPLNMKDIKAKNASKKGILIGPGAQ